MKDVFGKDLDVGQIVAMNMNGYTYTLRCGEVIGFTRQKVRIRLLNDKYNTEVLKYPAQLAIGG